MLDVHKYIFTVFEEMAKLNWQEHDQTIQGGLDPNMMNIFIEYNFEVECIPSSIAGLKVQFRFFIISLSIRICNY